MMQELINAINQLKGAKLQTQDISQKNTHYDCTTKSSNQTNSSVSSSSNVYNPH